MFKRLVLILVITLLISGCSSNTTSIDASNSTTTNATDISGEVTVDSDLFETKVTTNKQANLYKLVDGKFQVYGTIEANILLDTDVKDTEQGYIPLKDMDAYVSYQDIDKSDRWIKYQTHLVPFETTIKTKDVYHIYDETGTLQFTINEPSELTLYVDATTVPDEYTNGTQASKQYYGIKMQNRILYIPLEDVETIGEIKPSGTNPNSLPVLMYHFFYSEANGETRKDVNYVEVNELEEQCAALQSEGYVTLTMREIEYYMENKANIPTLSLGITIDDGDPSVYKYAYPILSKYGFNATLFLICGWEDASLPYEFIEMRESGLELQSHGFLMHQGGCSGMGHGGRLLCVDYQEGVDDTRQSFDYVDHGFAYCYPFGDVNENAKTIIGDAGAKLAFTTAFGKINPSMDKLELPRIRVSGGNGIDTYMNYIRGSE